MKKVNRAALHDRLRSSTNRLREKKWIAAALIILTLAAALSIFAVIEHARHQTESKQEVLSALAPEGYLIYGADDSAPPLRFVDDDGIYKGVVVDCINQLSLELGIEIQTVPYRWELAINALRTGETDLCDVFIDEERSQFCVFSDPLYTLRTVMAVRATSDYQLQDIHHMKVATQKGDYANGYLRRKYPEAELVYVHDVGEGLKLLIDGKVDGVIGDEPVENFYADKLGYKSQLRTIETSLYEEPVVLAVPKAKADLVPVLNEAIAALQKSGQMEKIQQKWFGLSTPLVSYDNRSTIMRIVLICLVLFSLILAFAYVNNKTLKRQVVRRTRELEYRTNELQLIFDQMPEGIVLVDDKHQVINGNYRFFRRIGEGVAKQVPNQPCDNLLGTLCDKQICPLRQGEESVACPIDSCLQSGKELVRKLDLGNEIFELRAAPTSFVVDNQKHGAVLITVRNITLDEINSRQLLRTSKMVAVGQLAAGMAHQIRNPLGIIRTQSYLIRNSEGISPSTRKSLDYIDDNVNRAGGIIDNVLNFWRVSDDVIADIPLKKLLHAVLLLQENELVKRQITFSLDCPEDLSIFSNEESLKHIFHNLISNSIDAMPHGGTLSLSARETGNHVEIKCADTGCGISEKNMQNLFNPFFTTKEPGKGTGLGLFIVYSEMERLGGKIQVNSKEGEGTVFVLIIPKWQVKQ